MEFETLLYREENGVAYVTLNRPEVQNSFDLHMVEELAQARESLRWNVDVRAVVLTGAGEKAFCTGFDRNTIPFDVPWDPFTYDDPGLSIGPRVNRLWKPVIAAVNGLCVAGGMEMLLGTDIRIASEQASFGISEPKRGLFPGGGTTVRLPRQIPFPWAMEILLTGEFVDAGDAFRMGLVNKVVPQEELLAEARKWAEIIMANAPLAISAVKRSVLTGLRLNLKEAFEQELALAAEVFMTEDAREGPLAFAQKRKPEWKGK